MRSGRPSSCSTPGPGFDHGLFKVQLGPWLSAGTQVVYTDLRGGGRSDRSTPEERRVERWADDVKDLCDAIGIVRPVVLGLGFGSVVALEYAARHPEHPAALVLAAPSRASSRSGRSRQYERLGGSEARAVAERFYEDGRAGLRRLRACLLPAALELRAHERRDRPCRLEPVLMEWMAGEAKQLDLREELAAIRAPAARAGRRGRRVGAARVGAGGLRAAAGPQAFRSYTRGRHSVFRDAPEAYEDMRLFLDDIQAGDRRA